MPKTHDYGLSRGSKPQGGNRSNNNRSYGYNNSSNGKEAMVAAIKIPVMVKLMKFLLERQRLHITLLNLMTLLLMRLLAVSWKRATSSRPINSF